MHFNHQAIARVSEGLHGYPKEIRLLVATGAVVKIYAHLGSREGLKYRDGSLGPKEEAAKFIQKVGCGLASPEEMMKLYLRTGVLTQLPSGNIYVQQWENMCPPNQRRTLQNHNRPFGNNASCFKRSRRKVVETAAATAEPAQMPVSPPLPTTSEEWIEKSKTLPPEKFDALREELKRQREQEQRQQEQEQRQQEQEQKPQAAPSAPSCDELQELMTRAFPKTANRSGKRCDRTAMQKMLKRALGNSKVLQAAIISMARARSQSDTAKSWIYWAEAIGEYIPPNHLQRK